MQRNSTPSSSIYQTLVLVVLALLLTLTACVKDPRVLRMHIPDLQPFDPESMQSIFAEQSAIRPVHASSARGLSALDALLADEADLALLENSTAFVPGIRAVLPIFDSVLHVLVRQGFTSEHPQQPLRDATIHVTHQSLAGQAFVKLITRRQGLAAGEYREVTALKPGEVDVIIYFGPIDPDNQPWFHSGFELVSPGKRFNPLGGFFEDRVGYIAPHMKPTVIPAYTYDLPGNDEPLLTVAVDTLLVARKDVPAPVVFELTRTLLEQKPRFTAIAPHLFAGINESFDPLNLSFPLHKGARLYLERNEPSLLERYAESINLLMYAVFLSITGLVALTRWRARRKKDRIDTFYVEVLAVRERMGSAEPSVLLEQLANLEQEAFSSLIRERLAANESFRIFTDLLSRVRAELQSLQD